VGQPFHAPVRLRRHVGAVRAVAFSPAGRWLYTAGDGTIRVCDLARPEFGNGFGLGGGDVVGPTGRPLEVRVDGPKDDGPVRVREQDGADLLTIPAPDRQGIIRSPDGRLVVRCPFNPDPWKVEPGRARTVVVADRGSGAARLSLVGHTGGVVAAAFSPDSTRVVTASEDETIRMWDAATGQELLRLPHPGPEFRGPRYHPIRLGFSLDGRHLAFVSGSRLRLWSVGGNSAEQHAVQEGRGRWWHVRQAKEAVGRGDKFAALFHLRFCDQMNPELAELPDLRRRAHNLPNRALP
jgi:WD40 repeat protein